MAHRSNWLISVVEHGQIMSKMAYFSGYYSWASEISYRLVTVIGIVLRMCLSNHFGDFREKVFDISS